MLWAFRILQVGFLLFAVGMAGLIWQELPKIDWTGFHPFGWIIFGGLALVMVAVAIIAFVEFKRT